MVIPIILGLLFLILASKGFQWAYLVGTLLIFGGFIFGEVKSLLIAKDTSTFDADTETPYKIYYLSGILQSVLSIIGFTLIIGLVAYAYFYQKDMQTIINEAFQPRFISPIFLFLGSIFSLTAFNHFLGMWLTKNYRLFQILYSFKVLFIGFAGIFFLILGIFYLIL